MPSDREVLNQIRILKQKAESDDGCAGLARKILGEAYSLLCTVNAPIFNDAPPLESPLFSPSEKVNVEEAKEKYHPPEVRTEGEVTANAPADDPRPPFTPRVDHGENKEPDSPPESSSTKDVD